MSPIVGQGTTGDFVKQNQVMGTSQGFEHVSAAWLPNTMSFGQAIEQLEGERSNRQDLLTNWRDWRFSCVGTEISVEYADGRKFKPTDWAWQNLAKYSNVSLTHLKQTLSPDYTRDDVDTAQLCSVLNYRKQREHMKDKKPRQLLFRTYGDGTLRAVLTDEFTAIDNVWVLKLLSAIIPDGRVSHQRGDADTMFGNILIPDFIRKEEDSDYGGMVSFRNSEIGCASLDTLPSLFRAICRNGCIWDATVGKNYRQIHKGEIKLKEVAISIHDNITKQIELIPQLMDKFLLLRQFEFSKDTTMPAVIAAVVQINKLTPSQGKEILTQWATYEKDQKTAFGVVNAITRAGQLYDASTTRDFDMLGGSLIRADWTSIASLAKAMKPEAIAKNLSMVV